MTKQISLNTLWESATSKDRVFHADQFSHLPEAARRYLEHAIAPGTKLASAVRLHMHGEIKLKSWIAFKSEQVICWEHGLIWSATAWMNGLPIVGSDRITEQVYETLSTSAQGLSEAETVIRIKHYGFNELPEPARRSLFLRFTDQLTHHGSWGCLNGHHVYDFVNIHRYYFCHHSCYLSA